MPDIMKISAIFVIEKYPFCNIIKIDTQQEGKKVKNSIMPKIIPDIQTSIFESTKKLLEENGYTGLTLRKVAHDCGISVGTIYNYYPNKLILVWKIIENDWNLLYGTMQEQCRSADSFLHVLMTVYREIRDFSKDYWTVFSEFSGDNIDNSVISHHQTYIEDIADLLKQQEQKFSLSDSDKFLQIIAELILSSAIHNCDESSFRQLIEKIYS